MRVQMLHEHTSAKWGGEREGYEIGVRPVGGGRIGG